MPLYTGTPNGDLFNGDDADDTAFGGGGNDFLTGNGGDDQLKGEDGGDYLMGGAANDTVDGGADDDTLFGGDGDDLVLGGPGVNRLDGGVGNDTLRSGPGSDSLAGGSGNDDLGGGGGNDTLAGGDGDDLIGAGGGNDSIVAGLGSEVIDGGDGDDLLSFAALAFVTLDLRTGVGASSGGALTVVDVEHIVGTSAADRLVGARDRETLFGGMGDDTIVASLGRDSLDGGVGLDQLDLSTVSHALAYDLTTGLLEKGGARVKAVGFEQVVLGRGDSRVFGTAAAETVRAGSGSDSIALGEGDDVVLASSGEDTLDGGAGTDILDLGQLAIGAQVRLDLGTLTATGSTQSVVGFERVLGGAGSETVFGGASGETLTGGEGDDLLKGGDGRDRVEGELGNDIVDGGADDDTLLGGAGDDSLLGGPGMNSLDGGTGNDILRSGPGVDTLIGGAGDDDLGAGGGNDNLNGGDGDDNLGGGDGGDTLLASLGADTLDGGSGVDTLLIPNIAGSSPFIYLGVRVDLSSGEFAFEGQPTGEVRGVEFLLGGAGDDLIAGSSAARETLHGGGGDDTIVAGAGDDVFGDDNWTGDVLDLSNATAGFKIDRLAQTLTIDGVESTIVGFGRIIGGGGVNTLLGAAAPEYFAGTLGADLIDGRDGNDILLLDPSRTGSRDTLIGGSGDDNLQLSNYGSTIVDFQQGFVRFQNGDTVTISSIEKLDAEAGGSGALAVTLSGQTEVTTSQYDDLIIAVALDRKLTINGESGFDTLDLSGLTDGAEIEAEDLEMIIGSAFDDRIRVGPESIKNYALESDYYTVDGGAGNDLLQGQGDRFARSRDLLIGGEGDDTLRGASGNDTLTGGSGADVFRYDGETVRGQPVDRITDFIQGEDLIDISAYYDIYTWRGMSAFTGDRQVRFYYDGEATVVEINNSYDYVIVLDGHIELTAADFVL